MIKLCEYIDKENEYHDVVLFDTTSKNMFILDSIVGNSKYNGQMMSVDGHSAKKLHDLEEWEFTTTHFFGEGEDDEVTIDDLKNTKNFTVVVNSDTILCRNSHEDTKFYTFEFKGNKIDRTTTKTLDNINFEVDSIKSELKFIKKSL